MNARLAGLLAPCALLLLAACGGGGGGGATASKKRPPPLVQVARPEVRDVEVTLAYSVEIKPAEQTELQSKVTGYVEKVLVDRGDFVRRGQLLARVRPSQLPEQVNQAREQVGQAEAQLSLQTENARRSRELWKRGLISKAELDTAEAQLAVTRAGRGVSRATLGAAATLLREAAIVAPYDGFVTRRYLDLGALVSPGPTSQAIVQVMRIETVRVFVSVLERDVPRIRRGLRAHVTVDALPGRTFEGEVVRYAPALDPATRTLEVEIGIPNPIEKQPSGEKDRPLKPGMYGHAALRVDVHPRAVVLPIEAVVTQEEARFVYTVDAGKAHRVPVEIGFDGGNWLEISRGLTGDEQVIVQGIDLVSDGALVSLPQQKGASPGTAAAPAAGKK